MDSETGLGRTGIHVSLTGCLLFPSPQIALSQRFDSVVCTVHSESKLMCFCWAAVNGSCSTEASGSQKSGSKEFILFSF